MRIQFGQAISQAICHLNMNPGVELRRVGFHDWNLSVAWEESNPYQIAASALDDLCTRDDPPLQRDLAIILGVTQFLQECHATKLDRREQAQLWRDLREVLPTDNRRTALEQILSSFFGG